MTIIDITTAGPQAGGVCVGGPRDGEAVAYHDTEMPIMVAHIVDWWPDPTKSRVVPMPIGSYIWIGGAWRWSPSR